MVTRLFYYFGINLVDYKRDVSSLLEKFDNQDTSLGNTQG